MKISLPILNIFYSGYLHNDSTLQRKDTPSSSSLPAVTATSRGLDLADSALLSALLAVFASSRDQDWLGLRCSETGSAKLRDCLARFVKSSYVVSRIPVAWNFGKYAGWNKNWIHASI
jgi:hypothetical protein